MSAAIPAHAGRPVAELRPKPGSIRVRNAGASYWTTSEGAESFNSESVAEAVAEWVDGGGSADELTGDLRVYRHDVKGINTSDVDAWARWAAERLADDLSGELGPFDGPWPYEAALELRMRAMLQEHLEEDARVHACEPAGHVDVPIAEVRRIEQALLSQRPKLTGTPLPEPVEVVRFEREGR